MGADRPAYRNLVARNWEHATFDLVRGPWRWPRFEHRAFVVVAGGPTEHRFRLWLGPVHVTFWPKSRARDIEAPSEIGSRGGAK